MKHHKIFCKASKKILSLTLVFVILASFTPNFRDAICADNLQPQTIEFWNQEKSQKIDGKIVKTYGDDTFTVTISGAATTLSYSSSDESVAKITDTGSSTGTIEIVGVGETTISAMAIETDQYASAQAFFTLKVEAKKDLIPQTIEFSEVSVEKTYGDDGFTKTVSGAATEVSYTSSNTEVADVNISSGAVTIVGAGQTTITATAQEDAEYASATVSYILTVKKKSVDLPTAKTGLIYNGSEQTGVELLDSAVYTLTDNKKVDAGDYKAAASLTDKNNYQWTGKQTSEDQEISWSIAKKEIKVRAANQLSYVGEDLKELTYISDNLVSQDSFSGNLKTNAEKSKAGEYKITQGTLTAGNNYDMSFTEGRYVVAEKTEDDGKAVIWVDGKPQYIDIEKFIEITENITEIPAEAKLPVGDSIVKNEVKVKGQSKLAAQKGSKVTFQNGIKVGKDGELSIIAPADQDCEIRVDNGIDLSGTSDFENQQAKSGLFVNVFADENGGTLYFQGGNLYVNSREGVNQAIVGGTLKIAKGVSVYGRDSENDTWTLLAEGPNDNVATRMKYMKLTSEPILEPITPAPSPEPSPTPTPSGGGSSSGSSSSGGGGSWNVLDSGTSTSQGETKKVVDDSMSLIKTQNNKTLKSVKLPDQLKTKKYITGYEDKTFKPEGKMTRAEVAQAIYKLINKGEAVDNSGLAKFSDVKTDMWYSKAISYLSGKNIINGDDGKFNPDKTITRAETAQILFNIIKSYDTGEKAYKYGSNSYDFKDINSWYTETVKQLASNGMINGYEDKTFRPNENITRAEFVAMIAKAFNRDISKATAEAKFTDVKSDHWAIKFINDAAE